MRAMVAAVASGFALTACGSSSDTDVANVADDFYAALADRDGGAACEALAPSTRSELEQSAGKPCEDAIVEEKLSEAQDPATVEVFDTAAEVRYDGETAFLARFDDGWKVTAAGCTPKPEPHPYDCTISGG